MKRLRKSDLILLAFAAAGALINQFTHPGLKYLLGFAIGSSAMFIVNRNEVKGIIRELKRLKIGK